VACNFDPDGSFPNHEPNPLLPENREFIVHKTLEEGADLGVAFDGDADRCFFVDDTGEFVPGDFATALLAETVLAKEPGAKIIYDVRASWAVPETITRCGGEPLMNRVGHAFIKDRMRRDDAAFGGEVSGHYYFREFSQADTGVVPFLLMLEVLSRGGGAKLSDVLAPFRSKYFITGELNTPVADVALKLQELKERYAAQGARISHLDGISVDFDDWHFNVRPSNTEPLLRLNLEALSQELMEQKRDEVLELIRS
jgi:phosphomannomutase